MKKPNHRLIFVFHILDDINKLEDNPVYDLHFKCLEYYSYVFDEAIFIITADDLNNKLICEAQYMISNIFSPFCKLKFIIEKNNKEYREGIHFYNYVLKRLDEYDGLTMFGHTKCLTHNYNDEIKYKVLSLYCFNIPLNDSLSLTYFCDQLLGDDQQYYLYGFPYVYIAHPDIKNWYFSGSFYWMNCKKIAKYIKDNNIDIDAILNSNFTTAAIGNIVGCAEWFFPSIFEKNQIAYYNMDMIKNDYNVFQYDFPGICLFDNILEEYIKGVLRYNDYNYFKLFYKKITNEPLEDD